MSRLSLSIALFVQLFVVFAVAMPAHAEKDATASETADQTDGIASSAGDSISKENSLTKIDDSEVANVPLAGHSEHGDAYNQGPRQNAYLMGGTGQVDLKVTTAHDEVQAYFDQGLGQLYGFWYYEAERSFRRVVALDPNCAMGYWGLAQSNIDNEKRAVDFIGEAHEKKGQASEHEQMYIDALYAFFPKQEQEKDKAKEKELRKRYVKDLEKIIREYPNDMEAKAMLALHLWQSSRHGLPIVSHQAVDSLLEEVFRNVPNHPAHHFRIHLWDHEEPSQALASASVCGQAAPSIAHMWHMPGHIYSRLHRYHDAIFQQEASARADHAHMMRDGVLPDQIHNYAHNNEWLIRNLIHVGRANDAMSLARNMLELPQHPKYNAYAKEGMCSCKYGRLRLLQILETFEMRDELVELCQSVYLPATEVRELQTQRLRALGNAHFSRGESEKLVECLRQLDDLGDALRMEGEEAGRAAEQKLLDKWAKSPETADNANQDVPDDEGASAREAKDDEAKDSETTDVGKKLLKGIATASKKDSSKEASLTKENSIEDEQTQPPRLREEEKSKAIKKARKKAVDRATKGIAAVERATAELRGLQWLARAETDRAKEQFEKSDCHKARLAEYYFLCGDHEKAVELLQGAVESGKNEVYPLAKQVDLLRKMGKTEEAQAAFEKLRHVAGLADLDSPLFTRLEKFANKLEYPTDWRKLPETSDDVGDRPSLNTLGPLRWAPSPARPWSLSSSTGAAVSLSDFRGRPVVVIFYLGAGCLHCVEQLHEFAPMQKKFESAGISLVAISTESEEHLESSLDSYNVDGDFPFPLVANENLSIFKDYRVYDDFENMPLHGTFLIDAQGFIRWCDVSYEPFLDAEFLYQECQRLLATKQSMQD